MKFEFTERRYAHYCWILIAGLLCFSSCVKRERTVREQVQQVDIAQVAGEALRIAMRFAKEEIREIPSEYWGKEMRKLKPLRVYRHGFSIVLVVKETEDEERGVYVPAIISSRVVLDGMDNFRFEPLSDGATLFTRKRYTGIASTSL